MMLTGGDLKEVTWSNPSVGQGRFFSKAGESHMLNLGGLKADDSDQNVDSGGNFLKLLTGQAWSYEATIANAENDPNRLELETIQALEESLDETTFTFTGVNRVVYVATGSVVGDNKADRSKATVAFKAMGGGRAQQVS